MTGAIAQDRERCQFPFVVDEKPSVVRAARPESGREAREVSQIAPLARNQGERRRRLALASSFGSSDRPRSRNPWRNASICVE